MHTRRDDPTLPDEVTTAPGFTVHHVDAGPAQPMPKDALLPHMAQFAGGLARHWAARRPDVVHAHFWMSGLASVAAARTVGIPVLLTYHASGIEKRRHQGGRDTSPQERIALERWLSTAVDRVIATTAAERRALCAEGASPDRVAVVPCGVDLHRFSPHGPVWPVRTAARRVVVVSRLVERKGIGNVVAALPALGDTELVIAGGLPDGLLEDDLDASRLRRLADALGVGDRVHLLGAVPRRRVPALLRSADVVACCPWYEPFGMVAVEAMACARPVVATRVGGLAETAVDGETGLLVPPRCPEAIAAALGFLLDEPETARRMGEHGAERARQFGWPRVVDGLLDQVRSVERERNARLAPLVSTEDVG